MNRPFVYGSLSVIALLVSAVLGFVLLGPVGAVVGGVGGLVVLFVTYGEAAGDPERTPEVRPTERGEED
ncbi:hypothetical protein [Halarchaeum nitratireducens]|uniref:Uncharacterized protein n=1 Tax=Halarchaeum nitratireducens TaxID=489913 RepID=A0A830GEI1_9EURY|nr:MULTISPECIES: hypothetical protein [Halarchaeum]MBP2252876.1 hypothetical protein [Halarchaeum solikamskense]GGN26700.1 hypothetical protein GCM10009021_31380 [Halarchaeum nitratireducens]